MKTIKYKAFAYITAQNQLLVFRHPDYPEAGIQVPAGTIEADEAPEVAVLREAWEETGLHHLTLAHFLGEQQCDMSDFGHNEIHHRYFYHLCYEGNGISTWRHEERHHSTPVPGGATTFEFFWVPLPDGVPPLIADHGIMLPELLKVL